MIDLRRLHVLRALHQYDTVTATARVLHLTPSAVSQQIRQLGRELGVTLLEPDGRRVRLTAAARILLDHADALEARWELACADLAAHAGGHGGQLRLTGFPSAIGALVAPAAVRLREQAPGVQVTVSESESTDGFARVLAGDADIAVVLPVPGTPPAGDARFEQAELLTEAQDLIVSTGHPFAARAAITLADAAAEPWVLATPGTCEQYDRVMVGCAAAGFSPRVVHRVTDWPAVAALVSGGLGVALVPRLVPLPPDAAVIRVPVRGRAAPIRHILTCVRTGSAGQPAIAAGLRALRAAAESRAAEPAAA